MEFGNVGNERSDKGFFIKIFIALVILSLLIGGYFYVSKSQRSLVTENNQSVPLPEGLERDLENKIPKLFPSNIIQEKNIQVIESYTQTTPNTEEATYRYVSKLSFIDAYWMYSKYLKQNNYANTSQNQTDDYISGTFEKPTIKVMISSSQIKGQPTGILEITIIKPL